MDSTMVYSVMVCSIHMFSFTCSHTHVLCSVNNLYSHVKTNLYSHVNFFNHYIIHESQSSFMIESHEWQNDWKKSFTCEWWFTIMNHDWISWIIRAHPAHFFWWVLQHCTGFARLVWVSLLELGVLSLCMRFNHYF